MDDPPTFRSGNKWMVAGLNRAVEFAMRHGVNARGVPGWREAAHGWRPPVAALAADLVQRWDLVAPEDVDEESEELELYRPAIVDASNEAGSFLTIESEPFVPTADHWLIAKMESLTEPEIEVELVSDWPDSPGIFEFSAGSPYTFVAARYPLWRFYGEAGEGRVAFGEDVFGEKLVRGDLLRMVRGLAKVPSVNFWRSVFYLV